MPSILEELLQARSDTKRLMKNAFESGDLFMGNIYEKRQLTIKVTANSLYGQCGAKTSVFYDKDVAASTTAIGRKLLIYGKNVIETAYKNRIVILKDGRQVRTNAEYVYGDTDSVFFKFNSVFVISEYNIILFKAPSNSLTLLKIFSAKKVITSLSKFTFLVVTLFLIIFFLSSNVVGKMSTTRPPDNLDLIL